MNNEEIINWLLSGDISLQYQTHRDLLKNERKDLKEKIGLEGWGAEYLAQRKEDGHWGLGFYQPKWTSSHYTLLELKNLSIPASHFAIQESVTTIANMEKGIDGGINPSGTINSSDVCINGMFLNYAAYFQTAETFLESVVDFILSQQLSDGGFNCMLNRSGATHSSLHSSLSVLEGISEYIIGGYKYRLNELIEAKKACQEFILLHQLYISDRTGEIIKKDFLRFSYPCRWRYDIFRALDYFRHANLKWDSRMQPALDVLLSKRNKDLCWKLQTKHPGKVFFDMEKPGHASRWNTLRALRILLYFEQT